MPHLLIRRINHVLVALKLGLGLIDKVRVCWNTFDLFWQIVNFVAESAADLLYTLFQIGATSIEDKQVYQFLLSRNQRRKGQFWKVK